MLYERSDIKKFLATRVARPSSAGVILENAHGEALLLKAHYKPYWSFPGGWVEDDQTPQAAALRELREETGLSLDDEQLRFAFVIDRASDVMHTYQFIFRAVQPFDDASAISLQTNEIADWRFVAKTTVAANPDEYGGAVQAWAHDQPAGYYEQRLD